MATKNSKTNINAQPSTDSIVSYTEQPSIQEKEMNEMTIEQTANAVVTNDAMAQPTANDVVVSMLGKEVKTDEVAPLSKAKANAVLAAIAKIQNDIATGYESITSAIQTATTGMGLPDEMVAMMVKNALAGKGFSGDKEADLQARLEGTPFEGASLKTLESAAKLALVRINEIIASDSPYMQALNNSPEMAVYKSARAAVFALFDKNINQKFGIKAYAKITNDGMLVGMSLGGSSNANSNGEVRTIGTTTKHKFVKPNLDVKAVASGIEIHITSDDTQWKLRMSKLVKGKTEGEMERNLELEATGPLNLSQCDGQKTPNYLVNTTLRKINGNLTNNSLPKMFANTPIYAD